MPKLHKPKKLSSRMLEVLALTANDKTGKDRADALCIAYKTLGHHHECLHLYLGVRSDACAVAMAVEHGWIVRDRPTGQWVPDYGVLEVHNREAHALRPL